MGFPMAQAIWLVVSNLQRENDHHPWSCFPCWHSLLEKKKNPKEHKDFTNILLLAQLPWYNISTMMCLELQSEIEIPLKNKLWKQSTLNKKIRNYQLHQTSDEAQGSFPQLPGRLLCRPHINKLPEVWASAPWSKKSGRLFSCSFYYDSLSLSAPHNRFYKTKGNFVLPLNGKTKSVLWPWCQHNAKAHNHIANSVS